MNDAHMHLDEGRIATLRDEGIADPWSSSHLDACAVCAAELADAHSRAHVVAEALAVLDSPVDVARAKAAVRQRLDRERTGAVPRRRRLPIGRAAAILLVTAGAASALPWSPLAHWWAAPSTEDGTSTQPAAPAAAADPATASIAVDVADGIQVIVLGASAGATIDVVWADAGSARVTAPSGSRFTLATGRVEVRAVEGTVSVELPRAARASLVVNGRSYLERSLQGATVETTLVEPAAEVTDGGVRFLVPGP